MSDCECLEHCPYFENDIHKEISVIQELRTQKYCKGDYSICVRYMVFKALGKEHVPRNLLPADVDRANEIIEQAKITPTK